MPYGFTYLTAHLAIPNIRTPRLEPRGLPTIHLASVVWRVHPESKRVTAVVLSVGFLLLVSLFIKAALAALGKFLGGLLPLPGFILQIIDAVVSLGGITLLFALTLKVRSCPDTGLASYLDRHHGDSLALNPRQVSDRTVSWQGCRGFSLWRGRFARRCHLLGVLFGADLSLRRRAHSNVGLPK